MMYIPVYYFLGSSVTRGSATDGVSFVEVLSERMGCCCIKNAVDGTTLADIEERSYPWRLRSLPPPEETAHFFIQLSTNDVARGVPIGVVHKGMDRANIDRSTALGGAEDIILFLRSHYRAPITFFTSWCDNVAYAKLVGGIYELRKKYSIGVLDFYRFQNMPAIAPSEFASYKADGTHPNAKGYRYMAERFIQYLKQTGKSFL